MEAHIIISYRQALGLSQSEMAALVGTSQPTWHRWEKSGVTGFRAAALAKYMADNPPPVVAAAE